MTETSTIKVHLMRHGEVHNPERIVYGRLPGYRLSDKGQQMVRLSAEEFAARAERGARFVHLVLDWNAAKEEAVLKFKKSKVKPEAATV